MNDPIVVTRLARGMRKFTAPVLMFEGQFEAPGEWLVSRETLDAIKAQNPDVRFDPAEQLALPTEAE